MKTIQEFLAQEITDAKQIGDVFAALSKDTTLPPSRKALTRELAQLLEVKRAALETGLGARLAAHGPSRRRSHDGRLPHPGHDGQLPAGSMVRLFTDTFGYPPRMDGPANESMVAMVRRVMAR